MKRLAIILLLLLVASNIAWAIEYRALWYDAAQMDGLENQAEHYIHNGCRN